MDGQIRRIEPQPTAAPVRSTLSLPSRLKNMVFVTGDVNAIPDLGDRRFAVFSTGPATVTSLRKAILDCARQATAAEPADTDRRLHSFIAKLSGTMEGLGERELDAVLWNLMETKPAPAKAG